MPSISLEGLRLLSFFCGDVSTAETAVAELPLALIASCPSNALSSITDITELRAEKLLLLVVAVEFEDFGVGGSGEFAWRFSGLGEPKLPMEQLVLEEDEACLECKRKLSTGGGIGKG